VDGSETLREQQHAVNPVTEHLETQSPNSLDLSRLIGHTWHVSPLLVNNHVLEEAERPKQAIHWFHAAEAVPKRWCGFGSAREAPQHGELHAAWPWKAPPGMV